MGDALVGEERYVFNGSDRRTDGMAKSGIDCPAGTSSGLTVYRVGTKLWRLNIS